MPLITTQADCIVFSSASGSDTLQGAINAAQSAQKPLFIAGGVYTTPALSITASLTVWAAKNSVIIRSSTGNAVSLSIHAASGRMADVVLSGLSFDGESKSLASGASGLVNFSQVDRIVVEDCFFWRSNGTGLYLNNTSGRVSSNGFDTCNTGIYSTNGWGITIENNTLFNSQNNGIYVTREPYAASSLGFDGTTIHRNRITQTLNTSGGSGQFGNAILCSIVQFVRITDNIISGANYSAIRANFCSDMVISGNQINNAKETAIFVENPSDFSPGWSNVTISANTLNGVGGGIHLVNNNAGSRRASVIGNAIYNSLKNSFPEYTSPDTNPANKYTRITYGSGVIISADCIAESNVIENTAGPGIMLSLAGTWNSQTQTNPDRNTISAIVSKNILKYCQVGIGYNDWDTRGFAEIAGNIIVGATSAQIIQMQATNLSGVPGNPNNGFGPYAIVSGASDQGSTSNAVTNRFSFDRNKVVPATN
ncbi:MAG TPA: TIGR03808 family TAT-translocated repetitive protein [Rhodoblastus sp.]|mgnify:CR=1 FL=1|nr:TIGR03808 family TAT-translocated repetitive protein [Rhodoblastus sp.]